MEWWIIFSLALGAAVGSFLNVLVLRYHTGRLTKGRSACMSCNNPLGALELIPVVSFLWLRGKCRHCSSKISPQYPIVEATTAVVFALLMWRWTSSFGSIEVLPLVVWWVLASLVIAIATYDALHKIIPDALVYTFDALALLWALFAFWNLFGIVAWQIVVAGVVVALPFALLWAVSRGRWMGLGDAKLSLGIGFLLGISGGFTALVIGVWAGALVSIVVLLAGKVRSRRTLSLKSEIPFGPFLVFGLLFVLLTDLNFFSLLTGM